MEELWSDSIYPLLSSPATTTVIALIAALGAFTIYFMRRRDSKKDAANIILLEIKNAERNLSEVRKTYEEEKSKNVNAIQFPEKLRLMGTESWTKYKYLFIRDLTPEQWDEIGKFYENCRFFDDAVEFKDSSFKLNVAEVRTNFQRIIGGYAKELADKVKLGSGQEQRYSDEEYDKLINEYTRRKTIALDAYIKKLVEIYNPDKTFSEAAYYFNLLPRSIVNTPTGQRLKELADRRIIRITRRSA